MWIKLKSLRRKTDVGLYLLYTFLGGIILIVIIIVIINDQLSKKKKRKIYDNISNKLNSPYASNEEIKLAYKYETGKSPFYTNHKDGTKLEYRVFKMLYKCEGKVLSNLYTNKHNGKSSESDIVFLHKTGIYIIECKDTKAINIVGNEEDINWSFVFSNKYTENRYNPLKQNIGHIRALQKVIKYKLEDTSYVSIIVTTCKNIKVSYTSNQNNYYQKIIVLEELKKHINSLVNSRTRIFSDEEVLEIYKYLHENYANVSNEQKQEHINNIKKKYNNR